VSHQLFAWTNWDKASQAGRRTERFRRLDCERLRQEAKFEMRRSDFILSSFLTEQDNEFSELGEDMEAAHQGLEKVTLQVETTVGIPLSDDSNRFSMSAQVRPSPGRTLTRSY
jgi:hypothetical protein